MNTFLPLDLLVQNFPYMHAGFWTVFGKNSPFGQSFHQVYPSNEFYNICHTCCVRVKYVGNSMALHSRESLTSITPMAEFFPKIFVVFPGFCRFFPSCVTFFRVVPHFPNLAKNHQLNPRSLRFNHSLGHKIPSVFPQSSSHLFSCLSPQSRSRRNRAVAPDRDRHPSRSRRAAFHLAPGSLRRGRVCIHRIVKERNLYTYKYD